MCRDKEEGEMKPKAEDGGATVSIDESNGDTDKAKPGETRSQEDTGQQRYRWRGVRG
jgi:hypothetical protein